MTLHQHLVEIPKRFDEKFVCTGNTKECCVSHDPMINDLANANDIRDFLLKSNQETILSVIEILKYRLKGSCSELEQNGVCGHWHGSDSDSNQLITEIISELTSAIKE